MTVFLCFRIFSLLWLSLFFGTQGRPSMLNFFCKQEAGGRQGGRGSVLGRPMILIMGSLVLNPGSPCPKESSWCMMSHQTDSKLGWKYQNLMPPPGSGIAPFMPALFRKAPSSILPRPILSLKLIGLCHRWNPLCVWSLQKGFVLFWMGSRKVLFFVYYLIVWLRVTFFTGFYILIQRRIFNQFNNTNKNLSQLTKNWVLKQIIINFQGWNDRACSFSTEMGDYKSIKNKSNRKITNCFWIK